MTAEQQRALADVIAARRDVRRFRPDQVPEALLRGVLEAAHAAPSVGHSQPWRFIVIRDASTRQRAAVLADAQRLKQASQLDPESARGLLDLQLEGIREAPIGIVVCCDRRALAAGVLGRATFTDADMWSCACAIENMWLTARAAGLGLGWVTLFDPADLGELVGLPEGVETLGWLCLGWPDERPPSPGLERAGWSTRAVLDPLVFDERWPVAGSAAPPPPRSRIAPPTPGAVVAARDAADALLTPAGSLGVLDRGLDRILALGVTDLREGTLILVGADHPVTRHHISAYPDSVTGDVLRAAVVGDAMGVAAARAAGLRTVVVDTGVRIAVAGAVDARPGGPFGDLVNEDALTDADAQALLSAGQRMGRSAAEFGVVVLGEVGVGNTTVAAALAAALLHVSGSQTVGRGAGADGQMLGRKEWVIETALRRVQEEHGSALLDPLVVVRALGGPEFVFLAGVTLGAAAAGAPVILDGLATSVAALVAMLVEPAVAAHLVAGHRSREPAHQLVLMRLGLEPLLDLQIRAGEGVGACLALGLLRTALTTRQTTATTA